MKTLRVVAAVIEKKDKILIAQRKRGDLAGRWEFPGGKIEEGESPEDAIIREIREELDIDIIIKKYLFTVEHQYPDFYLIMDCFSCAMKNEDLKLHDHLAISWISPYEKADYAPADIKVIENYRNLL